MFTSTRLLLYWFKSRILNQFVGIPTPISPQKIRPQRCSCTAFIILQTMMTSRYIVNSLFSEESVCSGENIMTSPVRACFGIWGHLMLLLGRIIRTSPSPGLEETTNKQSNHVCWSLHSPLKQHRDCLGPVHGG